MHKLKNSNYQRIIPLIAVGFLFVLIGFFGHAHSAYALCTQGTWADCFASIPVGVVWAVVYAINTVINTALYLSSYILDQFFFYNVVLNPNNMPAVLQGWSIVRDIANGLFILIVLWVALTIIFSLEQYGGRRLLFRIIVVALLINFSLVFVSVTFGFANALATPFRNAILQGDPGNINNDLGTFLMGELKIQTTSRPPSQLAGQQFAAGVQANPQGCGLSALSTSAAAGCRMANTMVTFNQMFADYADKNLQETMTLYGQVLTMVITSIIEIVVIITFLGASGMLLGRIVAMCFLGALAPAAFFSMIVPFGRAQNLWTTWVKNLFCWAFFAPIFYFLLYLSILMLVAMVRNNPLTLVTTSIVASVVGLLPVFVFCGFLWVTMTIGKRMACMGADTFINLGKAVGGLAVGTAAAVATGGGALAARAAGAAARGVAKTETAQGALEKLSNVPVVGGIAAPLSRQRAELMKKEQEDVDRRKKQLEGFAPRDVATIAKGSVSRRDQVAAMERLADTGDVDKLDSASQKKIFEQARRLGRDKNLEKVLPDLAGDTTAIDNAVKRIRPSDVGKISKTSFDNTDALNTFINNFKAEHYKQLARDNPDMLQKVFEHIDRNPNTTANMLPGTWEYLQSNAGRDLGLLLPAAAVAPASQPTTIRPLQITTRDLGPGKAGQQYTERLAALGGRGGYRWEIDPAMLPPGLRGTPGGQITGTPTTPGTYNVTIKVRDNTGEQTITYPIVINP